MLFATALTNGQVMTIILTLIAIAACAIGFGMWSSHKTTMKRLELKEKGIDTSDIQSEL